MPGTCDAVEPELIHGRRAAGCGAASSTAACRQESGRVSAAHDAGRAATCPLSRNGTERRASSTGETPLLEVRDLQEVLPDPAGLPAKTIGHVRAVDDVSFDDPRARRWRWSARAAAARRRPRAASCAPSTRPAARSCSAPRTARCVDVATLPRRTAAAAAPPDADDLPGPVLVAQPADDDAGHRRRAAAGQRRQESPGADRPGRGAAAAGRAAAGVHAPLSRTPSAAASGSGSASPGRWR